MIDIKEVKGLIEQTGDKTLSLYLDVSENKLENQASAPEWSTWAKNQMRDLGSSLTGDAAQAWPEIKAWAENTLGLYGVGRKPLVRGLVLFASPDYQHTYELPFPFENQAAFGQPYVAPLLWAINEYEPYIVVMVDKEKARFFTSYLASMDFQDSLEIDLDQYDFAERPMMMATSGGHEGAGTNKEAWQRTINEHEKRFYRQVATAAVKLAAQQKAERILIAGAEDSLHEVYNLLDDRSAAHVAGMTPIPMYEPTAEIFRQILPVAQAFERDQEVKLVSDVIDFAKSGGRGALGREAVDTAMEMQRIETLILSWPVSNPAMEEYTEKLAYRALQLNCNIELVHDAAADLLAPEGGVAARLYYAIETSKPAGK